ncbi:hypothetical protein C9374_003989 [Naegleria lovaniensis]|uniref:Uncharacterized protein n=1 Tax=Naegleria lovaniensis TaxID=51637 RepID=A0AA88KYP8_NAELO|nr:uncharacterized protein C9374_003989 [Naegleria lovaniensis]KAG2394225.1 hypothetical protein C9374_003989 [Naegleria lovaniensis]
MLQQVPYPQQQLQQQQPIMNASTAMGGYMMPSTYSGNFVAPTPNQQQGYYNLNSSQCVVGQGRPSTPVALPSSTTRGYTANQPMDMHSAQQGQVLINNWVNSQPNSMMTRKPCCLPESGISNNPKYLQELEGGEFQAYNPNKKYNRKKICFEVVKESKPRLENRWQTEHRDNFGYYACSNAMAATVTSTSPAGTPQVTTNEAAEFADVFADDNNNEPKSAKSQQQKKKASGGSNSTQKKSATETIPSQTKAEAPQLTESIERKSRGAYQNDDSNATKKKTKQELYADVYSKTLSKIQEKEYNQKKQLMSKQDIVKAKLVEEEKLSLERNQKELSTYMNRGEKAPFFPFGYCNTTPVSDKSYMVTYNVGPRDSTQVAKDIVARRAKTHEYDGWKKLLVEQEDYKQWRPKSYYWKTFDRFDKYNQPEGEERKERHSYGVTEADLKAMQTENVATASKSNSKKQSKKEQESKKSSSAAVVTEEQAPISSSTSYNEEKVGKGKSSNVDPSAQADGVVNKATGVVSGYAPEEYQQGNAAYNQPFFYPSQQPCLVQGMNNGYLDPCQQQQWMQQQMIRSSYEGPLCTIYKECNSPNLFQKTFLISIPNTTRDFLRIISII